MKHILQISFVLYALFCALTCKAVTVKFITDEPYVVGSSLRMMLWGRFSQGSSVALSWNSSQCARNLFQIQHWSENNNNNSWSVDFQLTNTSYGGFFVCTSVDGQLYTSAMKSDNAAARFRVWPNAPAALAVPHTVTAGQLFRVFLAPAGFPSGFRARGSLVQNASACDASNKMMNAVQYNKGFEFHVQRPSLHLFLCIAMSPGGWDFWSLVPFIANNELNRLPQPAVTGFRLTSPTVSRHFLQVFPKKVRFLRGNITCDETVAGVPVHCTLTVVNRTLISLTPSDVSFARLTDGGGVPVCPFPKLMSISPTMLAFNFIPQRSGFEGTVELVFRGSPLLVNPSNTTLKYFTRAAHQRDISVQAIPWYAQDASVMKLNVTSATLTRTVYNTSNLLNITLFNRSVAWTLVQGITRFRGLQNGSNEMFGLTLNSSASGFVFQTVQAPAKSERCRFRTHFYFDGVNLQHETKVPIGSVSLKRGSISGVTVASFSLTNYLRTVEVTGSSLARPLIGDVYSMEQLVGEIPLLDEPAPSVTIVLSVDSTASPLLYFVQPELQCTVPTVAAIDSHELVALRRIFNTVGQLSSSLRQSWILNGSNTFNGDPCTNHWRGVVCRNTHVVALLLPNSGLVGVFPSIRELSMLEELDVSRNQLTGSFIVNNTMLRRIDISHNLIGGILSLNSHQCLSELQASHNKISSFPSELTTVSKLAALDLSFNQLRSQLPTDFSMMSSLVELHLARNALFGSLPRQLPSILTSLDLSTNQFSGTIPSSWWLTTQFIQFVDISANSLNGTFPWSLPSQLGLGGNAVVRAADNFLSGTFPVFGGKLLDLRNNFFSCPLMSPEVEANTSVMNTVAFWGMERCDWHTARQGI